jgi:tRNA-dihydrouridine synthase 3
MEPETSKAQLPEASAPAPNMDVSKRDAANGDAGAAGVDEPPAKKARVEEPTKPIGQDSRDKGMAPIKAEYVQFLLIVSPRTNGCH